MTNVPAEVGALDLTWAIRSRRVLLSYLTITALVILLMMAFGATLRIAQAYPDFVRPEIFYQLMTVHGIGLVGISALGGTAIMWHFLGRYVQLSTTVLLINLALFLAGVAMILGAVLVGGFAGAWTFLYPLPAIAQGTWPEEAAAIYLGGLLLVGVGFLLMFLDAGRAVLARYRSPFLALGWPQLFADSKEPAPPPAVVVGTMVVIVNVLCILAGAAVILASLVNLYDETFAVDPLLAKNVTYFFGHTFINSTIYMAVIAVYEILPRYTGRPWKVSKMFLGAWTASTVMVLVAFPHHLLMDFVMPTWMLVAGQIFSYMNGLPILVVTAYGALTYVYRSGIAWDVTSRLLFVSMFGWAAGVIPAILDATIVINHVMHNTLWVPGHFHFYLLLGVMTMIFGFMFHLADPERGGGRQLLDSLVYWAYLVGSLGLVGVFLYSGSQSVPRRWAVHVPEWVAYDRIGTVFALVIVAAVLVFVVRFLASVPRLASQS
jgi:cytochrome c oxidase subunit 1